jgi:hypothetical protein
MTTLGRGAYSTGAGPLAMGIGSRAWMAAGMDRTDELGAISLKGIRLTLRGVVGANGAWGLSCCCAVG